MESLKDKLSAKIKVPKLSAQEWLNTRESWPLLDVRSEGEFFEGHIPGSISGAILNNEERHQVGLTYKLKGQEAAIALGLSLIESQREQRIKQWLKHFPSSVAVTCWRGGLRSRFASGWLEEIAENKLKIVQIMGGYKAIRRQLLSIINTPKSMWVIGGMTGSGKTILLKEMMQEGKLPKEQIIDLEGLANHRGSSFGNIISEFGEKSEQPRQQTFENHMGLQLFHAKGPIILENESTLIGKVFIPPIFRAHMKLAPLVILETPLVDRVAAIFEEYVRAPLEAKCSQEKLWLTLSENLKVLERRLGGKETAEGLKLLNDGFKDPLNLERQTPWIQLLLTRYYDKAYARSLETSKQTVVFHGNKIEIKQWLKEQVSKRM